MIDYTAYSDDTSGTIEADYGDTGDVKVVLAGGVLRMYHDGELVFRDLQTRIRDYGDRLGDTED